MEGERKVKSWGVPMNAAESAVWEFGEQRGDGNYGKTEDNSPRSPPPSGPTSILGGGARDWLWAEGSLPQRLLALLEARGDAMGVWSRGTRDAREGGPPERVSRPQSGLPARG